MFSYCKGNSCSSCGKFRQYMYISTRRWRKRWHPTPVLLPGKSHGRKRLEGCRGASPFHGVAEGRTRLSDFTFTFHFHALEMEMATHSSVLAWRIPGTREPGGLLSMRSHRVRHDWSDLAAAVYIYQYYFFNSSHSVLIPLCPQVHSLCLYLYSCPATKGV